MDHKMITTNQKRPIKQHLISNKTKKKDLLKVVYITDPIKFKATASEFRALVQELTGQGSDVPENAGFSAGRGGGEVDTAAAAENRNRTRAGDQEGIKMGRGCEGALNGSDPLSGFGSYDDNDDDDNKFQGLMASSFLIDGSSYYLDDEFKG